MELQGLGASSGSAVGRALVVERDVRPIFRMLLEPGQVEAERQRLQRAVAASRRQLQAIRERLAFEAGVPHAYVFDAHLLMLEDPLLLGRALALVGEERVNAEWALHAVSEQLHARFELVSDDYLRERSHDLDDVLGRIQLNLGGPEDAPSLQRLPGPCVLVAEELSPSEAAELDWQRVLGVALAGGSPSDHVSILARSRGIPIVVGLGEALRQVPPGSLVALDAQRGRLLLEPSASALEELDDQRERGRREDRRLRATRSLPAVTRDGVAVALRANLEFPEDVEQALAQGALGIGLFRSEYLLRSHRSWPDEQQQYAVYSDLCARLGGDLLTVRLWDLSPGELGQGGAGWHNPALGERALRQAWRDRRPFKVQLRALLRAALRGPVRVLVPFVTGLPDVELVQALLGECRAELEGEGVPCAPDLPLGATLEVPAAAIQAAALARRVDFMTVGTNDLVQYLLAVDRSDPRVARLYEPLHPAVLRVVSEVLAAGRRAGVPVAVCGEMAADPLSALALVGLGARELSMTPAALPRVKEALRAVEVRQLEHELQGCLGLDGAAEVAAVLRRACREAVPAPAP